jgi:hypothetical protein
MIKELTVKGVEDMFKAMRKQGMITGRTKVQLSCDEEGNHFSPLITVDGKYNVGIEEDKSIITLYPA